MIWIQVGLIWLQIFLWSIVNGWLLHEKMYDIDRALPTWAVYFDSGAFLCFWLSHWLYTSQFFRVAIQAPVEFGKKT